MSLKNPLTPPGIDLATVQLVAQRLKHYTIPGPYEVEVLEVNADKLSTWSCLEIRMQDEVTV